jgi:hypothetical protein
MLHAPAGRGRRAARAADGTWEPRQPSADDRRRLLAGETVSVTVVERTDRDLASGVVGYLPLPVARVGEYLAEAELAVQDPGITAWAAVRDGASPEAIGRLRLGAAETEELLESRSGSVWNLSHAEAESLRALRPALGGPARAGLAQATTSAQYRMLLLRRAEAYRAGGLAPSPTWRGGGVIVRRRAPHGRGRRPAPNALPAPPGAPHHPPSSAAEPDLLGGAPAGKDHAEPDPSAVESGRAGVPVGATSSTPTPRKDPDGGGSGAAAARPVRGEPRLHRPRHRLGGDGSAA